MQEIEATHTPEEILSTQIAALVPTVASQAEAHEAAVQASHGAGAALLERVVQLVKPALRPLSTRPVVSSRTFWPDRIQTATEETRASWSGVLLAGSTGPGEDFPNANQGTYEGQALYLLPDGTFRWLTFSGTWSRWQGVSSEWETTAADLSMAEVVHRYSLADLLAKLLEVLQQEADGKRPERTAAATARAVKLQSIVALLGGGR